MTQQTSTGAHNGAEGLPGPKWHNLPEFQSLVWGAAFAGASLMRSFVGEDNTKSAWFDVSIATLLAFGFVRVFTHILSGHAPKLPTAVLFGLAVSAFVGIRYIDEPGFFAITVSVVFLFCSGLGMVQRRPLPLTYDRSQVYLEDMPGPSLGMLWGLAIGALVTSVGSFVLTHKPAWAVLFSALFLAFTPFAHVRNPLTARPWLSRLINLIALCLIAAAAYSLI